MEGMQRLLVVLLSVALLGVATEVFAGDRTVQIFTLDSPDGKVNVSWFAPESEVREVQEVLGISESEPDCASLVAHSRYLRLTCRYS
jgi:uncharacterized protein (DUF2141 family)